MGKDKYLDLRKKKSKSTGKSTEKSVSKGKSASNKRGKELPENSLKATESKILNESNQMILKSLVETDKKTISSYFQ